MARTNNALKIVERMTGEDRRLKQAIAHASVNFQVAQLIYDARRRAELSQQQLARLVGTTQSVISRLEDADYRGHSLSLLQRIAAALHSRLEIRLLPSRTQKRTRRSHA